MSSDGQSDDMKRDLRDTAGSPRQDTDWPVVLSSELLGDRREIAIQHGDEVYRLRLTSNNRLILTK